MDREQAMTIGVLLSLFLFAMAGAYWFSQTQGSSRTTNAAKSGVRFEAKAGTTRQNAVILSTSKRDAPTIAPGSRISEPATAVAAPPKARVRSLSSEDMTPRSAAERAARDATNLLSPAEGITRLHQALQSANSPEDVAVLQEALAQLYAEQGEREAALAAFAAARAAMPGALWLGRITAGEARALVAWGDADAAMRLTQAAVASGAAVSPELLSLHGTLLERQGDTEGALAAYTQVLDAAEAAPDTPADPAAVRLAAMNLARLYRARGEDARATATAERFHAWYTAPDAAAALTEGEVATALVEGEA